MERNISIAEDVYWVGVNDRRTDLFEGMWPLPRGVSYNSYLINDEKVVLTDTVKKDFLPLFLEKIKNVLGSKPIDYLIIHHLEPDHSGSIPVIKQLFPDITIIGNAKTAEFLEHLFGITENVKIVNDGEVLNLGSRTLKFYMTPMVHWPETMMTYDQSSGILFSGDAFGGFGTLDGDIFDDKLDIPYFEDEILRYFSNIVGKFTGPVQKALAKLGGLDIKVIAATHGPIWRSKPEEIIGLYSKWGKMEAEPGVVIAYGSMYGSTEKMMEAVAGGVVEAGCTEVRVHDLSRTHVSYVIRDTWRYKGLILGSPTYDIDIFPPVKNFVSLLAEKKLENRYVGVFGSYGWSGGAVKNLQAFAESSKMELVDPIVESRFSSKQNELELCRQLGRNIAKSVME